MVKFSFLLTDALMKPRPIVLIVLDGWGYREAPAFNAIAAAKKPVWEKLWRECPHTILSASGPEVGLPEGQIGNSEVGHLTMGAGRVVFQDLPRISQAIESGHFNDNPTFLTTLDKIKHTHHTLHIMGLLSKGGVHSHEAHLFAFIRLAAARGVQNIMIHAFLDGRDTPPQSATDSLSALEAVCHSISTQGITARIASLSGRYYAMDRDQRWERTKTVYELMTEGKSDWFFTTPTEALMAAYARGETDEFIKPSVIIPSAQIASGDTVVFMNFRADRARQLSQAFVDPQFTGFSRSVWPKLSDFITLTEYAAHLDVSIAFPPIALDNTLGEYLQNHSIRQLRIAETEKYAHVTFFFNGGRETPFKNEERLLIPSLKIPTYDLQPEMSAVELTEQLITAIQKKSYEVIICNYANADMIGHTGNYNATVQTIETIDTCLGKVIEALQAVGGEALITADHGNAEIMFDEITQQPYTAHTLEPVPFIYVGRPATITKQQGNLADIAPTLITLLGLPVPAEMTGRSLLKEAYVPLVESSKNK
jgi:2,3-bisphosphoglycerate-independent phosphoglycerate mutase